MKEDPIAPRRARPLFALLATSGLGAVQACSNRGPSDIVPLAGSVWGTEQPAAAAKDLPKLSTAELAAHACSSAVDCNDINSCTQDWCEAGRCSHPPEPSGVRCGSRFCDGTGSCTLECSGNADCRSPKVCVTGHCMRWPG